MNDSEKDKLIKRDMNSIENIVRHAFNQGYDMGYTDGKETIKALEQEPKTGHWKQISPARIYECDICGQNVMTDDISAYRYCHGCGAKMVEPQESEDKCKKCEYHRNPDYTR